MKVGDIVGTMTGDEYDNLKGKIVRIVALEEQEYQFRIDLESCPITYAKLNDVPFAEHELFLIKRGKPEYKVFHKKEVSHEI